MMAVCGIGKPSGRLNSATTAYQSASLPIVAASAKAATKPNAGWIGKNNFATTNSVNVPASTSVARRLTRLSSAARAASMGAKEYAEKVIARCYQLPSLRAKRSNPESLSGILDCFLASAPRNEGDSDIDLSGCTQKRRPA